MDETDLKIIKAIGDKELSFGCLIRHDKKIERAGPCRVSYRPYDGSDERTTLFTEDSMGRPQERNYYDGDHPEVVGLPVTNSRLFAWLDSKNVMWFLMPGILRIYANGQLGPFEDLAFESKELHEQPKKTKKRILEIIQSLT